MGDSHRPPRRLAVAVLGLAVACAWAPRHARADTIALTPLAAGTTLVYGQESDVLSFTAPGPGTLEVQLRNLAWPEPLKNLSVSLMSSHDVLGSLSTAGILDVNIGQKGLYYAYFVAKAGTTLGLNLGLYSYNIGFRASSAPVPLPSAIRLLLSGLALIGIARQVGKGQPGKLGMLPRPIAT